MVDHISRAMLVVSVLLISGLFQWGLASFQVSGTVGEGNYSYYTLKESRSVTLTLLSRTGDADIFASRVTEAPTYANWDYKSDSCGTDTVVICPASYLTLGSPTASSKTKAAFKDIYVGVFGSAGHPVSSFVLDVSINEVDNADRVWRARADVEEVVSKSEPERGGDKERARGSRQKDEGSSFWEDGDEDVSLFSVVAFVGKLLFEVIIGILV